MKVSSNKICGIFFIIFGVIVFCLIPISISEGSGEFGPRLFPKVVSILLVISGSGILFKDIMINKDDREYVNTTKKELIKVAILFVMMAIFIFLMDKIGFLISALLFGVGSQIFYKVKNWKYYAIISGLIVAIDFIFRNLLNVQLP